MTISRNLSVLASNVSSSGIISTPLLTTPIVNSATTLQLQTNGTTTAVTIDASQNVSFVNTINAPNSFGFKNRIINGAMGIWQRGTSFTNVVTPASGYTADRWSGNRSNNASNMNVYQQASTVANFQYMMQVTRTAGDTSTQQINTCYTLEVKDSISLAGSPVTFSFYANCGANFSASASAMSITLFNATNGTDNTTPIANGTNWSSVGSTVTLTTTMQKFTYTATLPANTTQVAIAVAYIPTGTAGANDWYQITGLQLEKGSTATSFDYRPYGTELSLCQRYYQFSFYHQTAAGTASADGVVFLPVQMRASPSIVFSDSAGTVNKYTDSAGNGLTYSINANSAGPSYFVSQAILSRTASWYQFNLYLTAEL